MLLTNDVGDWVFIDEHQLEDLVAGRVELGSELELRLRASNFVVSGIDPRDLRQRFRARREFLSHGPNLHVFVVTLRCNQTCVYCHASRVPMDRTDTDMRADTAERCVDLALRSTSPAITIEFQGGEPLANFPVVRHTIEYALERNRAYGKRLDFALVTNLSLMTDEKLDYLIDKRVQICTSVDGPPSLHDEQRRLPGASAFGATERWIRCINARYVEQGLDPSLYHVEALLTVTRASLEMPERIVDTYVELGCRALFLRPLDPFGFAGKTANRTDYPRSDYLAFYRTAVDYMLELNARGVEILERFASIFATKILTGGDPNYLDIRSPCGAGIGQLAYDHDGSVYTCDEGRMLHAMGDDSFCIGSAAGSGYRELVTHETVAAMVLASNLDTQPDCVNCAYKPYCGVCPVYNYRTQGSLAGRMRDSTWCAVHKGIQDYLFRKLRDGDARTVDTLRRWTILRSRDHFVQG